MGTIPPNLQALALTGFGIAPSPHDPALAGLSLTSDHGTAMFVVTRQQLLAIAAECGKCAEAMPKPS